MSIPVLYRRRAERFAELLDEADGGRRRRLRSGLDDELAQLVAVGHRVRLMQPQVEPNADFRVKLRERLVAAAEREGVAATVTLSGVEPRPAWLARLNRLRPGPRLAGPSARRARARAALVVGVAAGTLALSGMSAASGDALPGDALYGIKRSTERAQLALAGSDVGRGQLYLEFAKTRVAEAGAVKNDAVGLADVLADMDAETRQGVRLLTSIAVNRRDPAVLDAVDRFVAAQRRSVAMLLDQTHARARVLESLSLLDSVTRRTADLRASLACGSAGSDALGLVPRRCGAAARISETWRTTGRPNALPSPTGSPSAGQQLAGQPDIEESGGRPVSRRPSAASARPSQSTD